MAEARTREVSEIIDAVSPDLAARAAAHDVRGDFVEPGYEQLKAHGFFGAGVPEALGGLGARHADLCDGLRRLAHACPSTALAASMHTHLVAANVWKHLRGQGGEALLRRVASEQVVLVSTGAGDWLESNGTLVREGKGYRLSGKKPFASGGPGGDILVTSAVYDDPDRGERVLHFPVPFSAEGVTTAGDWDTLGMRGTGSNTIVLENVYIPDDRIVLDRPRQGWHPFWSVVLTVAVPIYMAPYVGIAEAARDRALELVRAKREDPDVPLLVGEMDNTLTEARQGLQGAIANAAGYEFSPDLERAAQALRCKTLVAKAVIATVDKAMEVVGGRSFFRKTGLERLFRDVRAAPFHPLPEKRQQIFTGRIALGMDPV